MTQKHSTSIRAHPNLALVTVAYYTGKSTTPAGSATPQPVSQTEDNDLLELRTVSQPQSDWTDEKQSSAVAAPAPPASTSRRPLNEQWTSRTSRGRVSQ